MRERASEGIRTLAFWPVGDYLRSAWLAAGKGREGLTWPGRLQDLCAGVSLLDWILRHYRHGRRTMKKISLVAAIPVALFVCLSLYGYWEYDATYTYYDPFGYYIAADGTWWASWMASGSGSYDIDKLDISGVATGTVGVNLDPSRGSSRAAFAFSTTTFWSTYHWVDDDGPKELDLYVEVSFEDAYCYYQGQATGDFNDTCIATCSSWTNPFGDGWLQTDYGSCWSFEAGAEGCGYACSAGSSYASNSTYGGYLVCTTDQADANDFGGWWPLYPPNGQYEGTFQASTPYTLYWAHSYSDEELAQATFFSYGVEISGCCLAYGQVSLYDPQAWGGFSAMSHYYTEGRAYRQLTGDIRDSK